ncbi:MAG: nitrogenase component 1 [Coriobacteriia bacterium]|nr:nitrogenase component 1 [Coriobacteriia bacterium]
MAYVSLSMPTATGDFSGAAVALYDLPCTCLVLDPKGCTMDYLEVEDPRLPEPYLDVRSARMDDVDVTLCDCSRLLRIAKDAVEQSRPAFLAVIGSTVSSIIGMDVDMTAQELEEQLGLPVVGVDADGFTSYAQGIHLATRAVIERFGQEQDERKPVNGPVAVNVLGMTPLDFASPADADAIRCAVEACGFAVNSMLSYGCTLDDVRRAPQAQLNLAVTSAGYQTARWMQQRYGIPFATCCPITADDPALPRALAAALEGSPVSSPCMEPDAPAAEGPATLIVGDAVMASSLRQWVRSRGHAAPVDVASFFRTADPLPGVAYLQGDLALVELVEQRGYAHVIGDPLLERLPGMDRVRFTPLPHPPLSSLIHRDAMPALAAHDPLFERLLRD